MRKFLPSLHLPKVRSLSFLPFILVTISALVFYLFTIRGDVGTPDAQQVEIDLSPAGQAFETSQERSRWAMILSIVNDHTIAIDNYASMGTPDIGRIDNHYYSFFPPGASVLAIPLYLVGLKLGITQMAVFSVSTIFSLLTMLLIVQFCRKLNLHWSIAVFTALSFGFATNAWGYSVTLYAHLISSFFILLSLYSVLFIKNWKGAVLFWLCYSAAVYIDFPNLFIIFPLALIEGFRFFNLEKEGDKEVISFRWAYLFTPLIFIGLMLGYGYYNLIHFGSPTTLSNAIPRVKDLKDVSLSNPEAGKEAVGALQTRNMLEGFRSFIISKDRGLLYFTPIAFFAAFGLGVLTKKKKEIEVLLVTLPLVCLVLYTMFGDPYGGWAFGSRYILAVMPELMILAGLGLAKFSKKIWAKILFTAVFIYSSAVSLLAPITTNVIPPYVEARYLNLKSTYFVNIDMLKRDDLNSFFYNHVLNQSIPGMTYYIALAVLVGLVGVVLIWWPKGKYDPTA